MNAYTTDIDNQSANNYSYDAIGNLTADVKEGISSIEWTVYGKIKTINKTDGTTITYKYDAAGNRVSKTVGNIESWYVRDASGNILSIYTAGDASVNSGHLTWSEADIYGSSRLGTYTPNKDMTVTPPAKEDLPTLGEVGYFATFTRGQKHYELTNHLGNVLAVISDKKIQVSSDNVTVSFCKAYIESANDYYPGGMAMPMRTYIATSSLSYRYGFNGKEKDNEVKGEGNQYDYGMRIYDPRAVRFLSVDPLAPKYPELTPYQFASNRPIDGIDLDGLEWFKKDNTQYTINYKPVLNTPNVLAGANNAAHNTLAFIWNGTLGALMEGGKGINNYIAGGYKEQSSAPDPVHDFMESTNDVFRYHTRTPFKQQLSDFADAATDLKNYEIIPSIVLTHTLSSSAASAATFSGDIISARKQLASNWGIHVENVNFEKQVFTQAADVNTTYYQYRIPGTEAGAYYVKSLDITPEQVGLLSSEYTDVYKVTVTKRSQTLVSTHIEDAKYWRDGNSPVQGGGQLVLN
ncbi:RHS repeat domain-containing protein [Parafilimonas terrae]|uniref:RHS repeat-associated core domain-containing protein n=1 Tax=Parafilimonas terrae TaxID=1465490 RepID=A0A1I5XGV7_9BACT|nr:RHS repeat-associated core domain-containing protein [Parafilimonas terrae]SFQ31208.1 RHS repeat-associated core domain-containing protein [Parafilimonas terrae]